MITNINDKMLITKILITKILIIKILKIVDKKLFCIII